jgi:hypothetical protein
VVNRLEDGREIRLADSAGSQVVWELTLRGLSEAERQSIEDLFRAAEGRAGTFVFLDPGANLLQWSEDLSAEAWAPDPLLTLAPGVADPLGTTRATRVTNTGQAGQRIVQTVDASSGFEYCLSVRARSSNGGRVGLVRGSQTDWSVVGARWTTLRSSGDGGAGGDEIAFGAEIPAGETVELCGFQAEAQPGASGYKKTGGSAGVYLAARFDEDRLSFTAEGPGSYSTVIRVASR